MCIRDRGRNSPPSDVLLAICKLYGTSADYLLGLTDIDPSDEARKQRQRLTEEEQNEMHRYEEYLLSLIHIWCRILLLPPIPDRAAWRSRTASFDRRHQR